MKTCDLTKGQRLERMEKERAENEYKARAEFKTLTDKDEWPENEHEARFEALTKMVLFAKPPKRR